MADGNQMGSEAVLDGTKADNSRLRSLVMVAGMHRSGTSACTRVLNLRGLHLAEDLMQPGADNERGFWESQSLAEYHDRFFRAIDYAHDCARSLPSGAMQSDAASRLHDRIVNHIGTIATDSDVLVKDPRISIVLPVWLSAADTRNMKPKVVIMLRNPLEVAASLDRRDRYSFERSLLLWLRHMVSVERHSRGLNRVVVSYSALLEDWVGQTDRIAKTLDVELEAITEDVRTQVDGFLSKRLRHHEFDEHSLHEDPRVDSWVVGTYDALLRASRDDYHGLLRVMDDIGRDLDGGGDILESVISRRDAQMYEVVSKHDEERRELEALKSRVESAQAEAEARSDEIDALRGKLRDAETELEAERSKADMRDSVVEIEALRSQLSEESRASGGLTQALEVERERTRDLRNRLEEAVARIRAIEEAGDDTSGEVSAQIAKLQEEFRLQRERDRQALGIAEGELARNSEDLQKALRDLAVSDTDRKALERERDRLQAREKELLETIETGREEMRRIESKCETLGEALQAERLRATELSVRTETLHSELERARGRVEDLLIEASRVPALQKDISDLRVELAKANATLDHQKTEGKALKVKADRLAKLEKESAATKAELVALRAERSRARKAETSQKRRVSQLEKAISAATAKLRPAGEIAQDMDVALASEKALQGEIQTLTRAAEEAAAQRDSLRGELESMQGELERLRDAEREAEEARDMREQLRLAEEKTAWLTEQIRTGRKPRSRLASRLMKSGALGRVSAVALGIYSPRLARNPLRAGRLAVAAEQIHKSGLFDEAFYRAQNWDIDLSNEDPVMHYLTHGASEGRDPSPDFSTATYLRLNPDVARSGLNPLIHYIRHGRDENRFTRPFRAELPQAGERRGSVHTDPEDIDRYSIRPDDPVVPEARAGDEFLQRFDLQTPDPSIAEVVEALNSADLNLDVLTETSEYAPHVSIIIPVYGQLAYTLNCLQSLATHEAMASCEIIVVDDSSPDESGTWLPKIDWIRYVKQPVNGGFISSCNLGASRARGEYLVFLNNDTRVVPGWLDELVGSFSLFPKAGLVGSKLFYPDGSLQEAGGIFWRDGSAWNYGRNDDPNKPEYCYARQIDYVSGASIAVKTSVWKEVGGFDGDYYERAYCEDSDLAFQIRAAGYETWFQPLSRVIHYEGKTSGTDTATGEKAYQVSNQKKFLERWQDALSGFAENAYQPYAEANRKAKRIALVLDATSPMPWQDAGSVTVVNTIRALQQLGYRVVFAPQDNLLFMRSSAEMLQRMGVEVLHLPYTTSIGDYLEAHRDQVEIVHIFRYPVGIAELSNIRRAVPDAMVTFNVMDLHHVRVKRQAELAGDKELMKLADGQMKTEELKVISEVDTAFVHTAPEREIVLSERPDANVQLYPYVTDESGRDAGFAPRSDIMFLGGYDHTPNVDAVEFFANEVMPYIRNRLPGVRFHLAGSKVNARVLELESEDVVIDGFVPTLRDYFAKFRVFVAPLRYGAGIKGKVAASMMHGVPSVVSTIAAEGMDLEDGVQCFIRDEPEAIAEAIAGIYDNEAAWDAMSEAAMVFGEENYSLGAACKAFEDARRQHMSSNMSAAS